VNGISGTPQPQHATTNIDAWLGGKYVTLRLVNDVEAVRVYVIAAFGATGGNSSVPGTGSNGRWFAVGDVIFTQPSTTSARGMWESFARVEWCRLKAGSIVNVGRCSPLFGAMGGGDQVEWVSGPVPEKVTNAGT
jgi:hypothetical protein